MQDKKIFLCAINNILSGTCQEDCHFCTQSTRYRADIERYSYKSIEQIVEEAKRAKLHGALGYCLVTAGKGLDDKKTAFVAKAAKAVKQEVPNIHLIGCNGTASKEQLAYLKEHGIDSYNHNLESSESYYKHICTTHTWQERYTTCENAKSVGLTLCTGGIFGMGERSEDRVELLKAVASLKPMSTPLNFFHPNEALPIKERNITYEEALDVIGMAKEILAENYLIMVAGGRELLFTGKEKEMFDAGANAIVIGDYLTTSGRVPSKDLEAIEGAGFPIAQSCEELG
jgi:biotin synthase